MSEVKLAPEGTPLARFQTERTEAISEMFDNVGECGIYPTSKFFARLDACFERELAAKEAEIVAAYEDAALACEADIDCGSHDDSQPICHIADAKAVRSRTPASARAALAEREQLARLEEAKVCDDHAEELIATIGQPLPLPYGPEDMRLRDVRVKAQAYTARICGQRIRELEKQVEGKGPNGKTE